MLIIGSWRCLHGCMSVHVRTVCMWHTDTKTCTNKSMARVVHECASGQLLWMLPTVVRTCNIAYIFLLLHTHMYVVCMHVCMCLYMRTRTHTCIPTYHTYMRTYMRTCIHTCVLTYLHTCNQAHIIQHIHTHKDCFVE
jgi:hypothetical protein